jgi:hypothetical protein
LPYLYYTSSKATTQDKKIYFLIAIVTVLGYIIYRKEFIMPKKKKKLWTAAEMGRKGGLKSRRTLTPEQARAMVQAREAKRRKKWNQNSDHTK